MKKRKLSLALAIVLVMSSASVFAALPQKYPKHSSPQQQQELGKGSLESPVENVFYVKNDAGEVKSFILLDCDKDGNYFVIANDTYAAHKYYSGSQSDNIYLQDSEWAFNPENENSVAYWLNDESEDGFVKSTGFPAVIYDNIIPFDWQLENKNINIWQTPTVANVGEATKKDYDVWAAQALKAGSASTAEDPRFKIALMSATEYVTYNDKIGLGATSWKGPRLRSMVSRVRVDNGNILIDSWAMTMKRDTKDANTMITLDGVIRSTEYPTKPVFWLDKDFFKNVAVEIAYNTKATNVFEEIRKVEFADVAELYDDRRLKIIYSGYKAEKLPTADNIIVTGPKAVGALNEVEYTFKGYKNEAEGESTVELYNADSEDSVFEKVSAGKILFEKSGLAKLAVIPKSISGTGGKRAWSSIFQIEKSFPVIVTECEISKASENAQAELKLKASEEASAKVKFTLYDEDNAIVKTVSQDVQLAAEEKNVTISIENVTSGKLVLDVLTGENRPVYRKAVNL